MNLRSALGLAPVLCFLPLAGLSRLHASVLENPIGDLHDQFGSAVSVSGTLSLVGSDREDMQPGAAYLYGDAAAATGVVPVTSSLAPSVGANGDLFGGAVSILGNAGLVGASGYDSSRGAAYLFRGLGAASGALPESLTLAVSNGAGGDQFGSAVSLSGSSALVGAAGVNGSRGAAYYYRDVLTATGTITESVKIAPGLATGDGFGFSVSLSGSTAVIGAPGASANNGAIYLYRDLESAPTNFIRLTVPSIGAEGNGFGYSVSVSGNRAIAGAPFAGGLEGYAFVYRDLQNSTSNRVTLRASDQATENYFGISTSLSGNTALVGADGADYLLGAAYLYRNVDAAATNSVLTENVKIFASNRANSWGFGGSVSLDGDHFVIGAYQASPVYDHQTGAAYAGTVSSITTLDAGNASGTIDGISFVSADDWIIGQTTSGNEVILTAGDSATVNATDKAVYIGQHAGSDGNILILSGTLTANEIYIGSEEGNVGNSLRIDSSAAFGPLSLHLAAGNLFVIEGDYTSIDSFLSYLGLSTLQVWDASLSQWNIVDASNYISLLSSSYSDGYTTIQTVPEPGTISLAALGLASLFLRRRRA